jgi:hypothetical protein
MVDPAITREWISSKDPSIMSLKEDSEFLAAFYVDTRYPVHWPTKFSKEEAQKALQASDRIRILVKMKLHLSV